MVWTPWMDRSLALAILERMTGFQMLSQFWVWDTEVTSRYEFRAAVVSARNKSESHART
jgi:hypothetical protein